jgi:hypothetical protein
MSEIFPFDSDWYYILAKEHASTGSLALGYFIQMYCFTFFEMHFTVNLLQEL